MLPWFQSREITHITERKRNFAVDRGTAVSNLIAQLAYLITMIKKWFRVFGYIFLVVPGLDFMLTVKSSQKLSVPSVPNFKNVDFYSENEGFSAIFDNST